MEKLKSLGWQQEKSTKTKPKPKKYLKIKRRQNKTKKMLGPQGSNYTLLFNGKFFFGRLENFSFSVLSTCIATILTDQVNWTADIISEEAQGAVPESGITFIHVTKISVAEKFINIDVLVPFPKFELDLCAALGAYIGKLGKLCASPSWQCHLDYSTNFRRNHSTFGVEWFLHQVQKEVNLAKQ